MVPLGIFFKVSLFLSSGFPEFSQHLPSPAHLLRNFIWLTSLTSCLFVYCYSCHCAHGKLIGTLSSQKTQDNSARTDYDSILYLKQIPISDKYLKINLCFIQSSQSCYQNCSSWESEIFLSLLTYWFNLYSGHRGKKRVRWVPFGRAISSRDSNFGIENLVS